MLGVIAEGCCDAMRQGLSTILPVLLASIQDPEYFVRECACFALGNTLRIIASLFIFHRSSMSSPLQAVTQKFSLLTELAL